MIKSLCSIISRYLGTSARLPISNHMINSMFELKLVCFLGFYMLIKDTSSYIHPPASLLFPEISSFMRTFFPWILILRAHKYFQHIGHSFFLLFSQLYSHILPTLPLHSFASPLITVCSPLPQDPSNHRSIRSSTPSVWTQDYISSSSSTSHP